MKIAPISMSPVQKQNAASFSRRHEQQPLVKLTDKTPDDAIVAYGSWGPNYAYPITAGQIRQNIAESLVNATAAPKPQYKLHKESPEEYMARKINSTEWCM